MLFLPRSITRVSMLFMALCHLGLTERSLSAATGSILIKSPTDRSQLLFSEKVVDNDSGRTYDSDATRKAQYLVANPAIVRIDDRGGVVGLVDGKTQVTVKNGSLVKVYDVQVTGVSKPVESTFETDVQPILTRLGCNSGPCHGKQRGQNGFQLSLFGFDTDFDYNAVATENRGRRVFLASPENSLLLMKATAALPHGGGKRLDPSSPYYATILSWIRAGLPHAAADAPKPVSVAIEPRQ